MILFYVILFFSLLQTATTITSENLLQLLATHYDCPKQPFWRHYSLTLVQTCTQVASEIEYPWTFASVFIHAITKRIKAFRCSATIQKTRVFRGRGALNE